MAERVLPGLNPNQPNQRMIVPNITMGMLWPRIAVGLPSFVNFPIRGPSKMVPASAAEAP